MARTTTTPDAAARTLEGARALALLAVAPTAGTPTELERLAHTLGVRVVDHDVVPRPKRRAATYTGTGRMADLARRVAGGALAPSEAESEDAPARERRAVPGATAFDLVLVDAHLSPRQQAHLEEQLGVTVLDRTAVILRIFEQRAQTREARLEVELARLRFDLPRLRQAADADDRRGGGGRGERGHTNVQLAKMRIRDRIAEVARDLYELQSRDEARRDKRAEVWTVALVGYTNAGKSTLMRSLTGADVLAEDKLFATLGTTVRRLHPEVQPPILVSDTVGFIRELPHELVASFHSTIDEARTAALRLVVVDASDPEWTDQLSCVAATLASAVPLESDYEEDEDDDEGFDDIDALDGYEDDTYDDDPLETPLPAEPRRVSAADLGPVLLVFNKVDRLDGDTIYALRSKYPRAAFVSALDRASVHALRERILEERDLTLHEIEVHVPWRRAGLISAIRAKARIVRESHDELGTHLVVRGHLVDLERWASELNATLH
jgi:GTP-binding protein HflX